MADNKSYFGSQQHFEGDIDARYEEEEQMREEYYKQMEKQMREEYYKQMEKEMREEYYKEEYYKELAKQQDNGK
jgi:hypothetical protein